MFFELGDYILLRLHSGFNVTDISWNSKLLQQFAGPFKVLEKTGRLAYQLELSLLMRSVHPVISIAHLKLAVDPKENPFQNPFAQGMTMEIVPEHIIRRRKKARRNEGKMI